MDSKEIFRVDMDHDGERVDKFLALIYPSISRTGFQKLISDYHVLVNDEKVKKNATVHFDDEVEVFLPEAVPIAVEPENIPLDILFEDDDVLVINKPKNMVVHPSAGHLSGTVVNAVLYHCANSLSGINGELRPGIVHRIDKDTTGSLIICKNDVSHAAIAEQIKAHSCERIYVGIVCGNIPDDEGSVSGNIGRSPSDRKKMAVTPQGKSAVTHYKVLKRYGSYTYVQFKLETGRTHQIRVHMAHIGFPLLGDEVYGRGGRSPFKTFGQCLHARDISFDHPRTGERVSVSAPIPEYFETILSRLENVQY